MFNLTVYENLIRVLDYDPITGIFRWKISPKIGVYPGDIAGFGDKGYIRIRYKGQAYAAHTLAWLYVHKTMPAGLLDHKNLNKADNSIDNLRSATHAQNNTNKLTRADNTSGYKGVSFDRKQNKWRAQISINKVRVNVGCFDTPEAAYEAYCKAGIEAYGEFFNGG